MGTTMLVTVAVTAATVTVAVSVVVLLHNSPVVDMEASAVIAWHVMLLADCVMVDAVYSSWVVVPVYVCDVHVPAARDT